MLDTWNGSNRPTPASGEVHLEKVIPQRLAKAHEGLFFLVLVRHDKRY